MLLNKFIKQECETTCFKNKYMSPNELHNICHLHRKLCRLIKPRWVLGRNVWYILRIWEMTIKSLVGKPKQKRTGRTLLKWISKNRAWPCASESSSLWQNEVAWPCVQATNLQVSNVCFRYYVRTKFMILLNRILLHGEPAEQKSTSREGFWTTDLVNTCNLL